MRLLDRYVIRNFVQVYFYCIAGFISIWLIFDVSDNISNFIDNHIAVSLVVRYYGYADSAGVNHPCCRLRWLLSLLFALGRMSRANEIVSMLTAGVSLPRVLLPLIGIGLLTVAVTMALTIRSRPMRNWRGKRFSQKRSRVLPAIFRGKSFAIEANCARGLSRISPWRQPVQQRAGAATGRAGQHRHEFIRPLELITGLRQRHGIWRTSGSLTTMRLETLPRKSFVPR